MNMWLFAGETVLFGDISEGFLQKVCNVFAFFLIYHWMGKFYGSNDGCVEVIGDDPGRTNSGIFSDEIKQN